MKRKKITLLRLVYSIAIGALFTSYVGAQDAYAQEREFSVIEISNQKLPEFKTYSPFGSFNFNVLELNISPSFMQNHMGEWLGLDNDHKFELVKQFSDELGFTHSVYQHIYKDAKVQDELVILHEKDNVLTSVNGQISSKINISQIGSIANIETVKQSIQKDLDTDNQLTFGEIENVIVPVLKDGAVKHYYSTKIETADYSQLKAFVYYVDSNANVVLKHTKRYDADTPSTSATYYKGNQQITVDSYNGSYRLKDNARNIHTLNGSNMVVNQFTGAISGATEYTSTTANFTSNATKPAVEVHWGMKNAYDYYVNKHNRNSYDGNGTIITNYYNVDFSPFIPGAPQGFGFNAAALDMSANLPAIMIYGNGNYPGNPGLANPFVALDIAGHEYSHLIIGRNGLGGLNYQAESGALNESIADMLGAAIEFYSGISPNWNIGEGVVNFNIPFLRSMSNPNSGPAALQGQQPDTYHGTYWANTSNLTEDYGGVHTNSGVGNYWFYLLSVGGSGTNDIGNQYNVTGIGIDKAEKIIYRALTTYLTPNSTYLDAYNATKQAVADLYGNNGGTEWQSNIKAWYAVGIGDNNLSNNELQLDGKLSIYPNPVKDGVFTIDSQLDNDATYELFDVSGKQIIATKALDYGTNQVQVDGLQSGVYVIKINSGGASASKKVIIK